MTPQAIRQALRRPDAWPNLQVFDAVDSTIDVLRARAAATGGAAVLALEQRAGRGRTGRRWHSPRGGLWLSALLRPAFALERAGCVAVASAVVLSEALERRFGLAVQVKWPNDLVLRGRKLAGLLVDLSARGSQIDRLIVSVGLNVNNALPARMPAASLGGALERRVPLAEVAALVLDALDEGYRSFLAEGFAPFIPRWAARSALGERIEFERGGRRLAARPLGLSEDGKLLVSTPFGTEFLAAEDVHLGPLEGSRP